MSTRKCGDIVIAKQGKHVVGCVSSSVIVLDNPGMLGKSSTLRRIWNELAQKAEIDLHISRANAQWFAEYKGTTYPIPYEAPLYIWRT
jgi:hypothetical protein